jgi:hypothetical protein
MKIVVIGGSGLRGVLARRDAPREVITDPRARYFGINSSERTLLPGADAPRRDTLQRLARAAVRDRISP